MLKIPQSIHDMVVAHAREGLPLEICGILGGKGDTISSVHRICNTKASATRFRMEPREQIAAMDNLHLQGLDLLAFYHSHPEGPPFLSDEDIRLAFYPDVVIVIVSLEDRQNPVLGAFIVNGKRIVPVTVVID